MLTCGQPEWLISNEKSEAFAENDVVLGEDREILSGSVESLLHRLIPTSDFSPNSRFVFCVLVNLRTLLSPQEIMQRLVQKCMFSVNADAANFRGDRRSELFRQLLSVCEQWATAIPHDFLQSEMFCRLEELVKLCSVDGANKQTADNLMENLNDTLQRIVEFEKVSHSVISTTPSTSADHLSGLMALCSDPNVIAKQLTVIEMDRFSLIGLGEIVDAIAKGDVTQLVSTSFSNRGQNAISHYLSWFNRLSSLASTEVLRHNRRRHRIQVVEFLTDVARECCQLGNFNSLMALVAGLSLPAVARLKRTWSRVDKTKLDILQHQLDPSGNFLSYRATLKAAVWRASAGNSQQKIVIPFFFLLLKDLFLIYHGNSRVLPNGHVNFVAFSRLADQLKDVLIWKQAHCPFHHDSLLQQYLLQTPLYSENEAQSMSFSLETAEGCSEKELLRRLKDVDHKLQ